MAVVLKTVTSRSSGKASLPFQRSGIFWQIRKAAGRFRHRTPGPPPVWSMNSILNL
jgi:hypothetical protein